MSDSCSFLGKLRPLPVPSFFGNEKSQVPGNDLCMRPFGILRNDLNIDFSQERPFLVTEILQECVVASNGEKIDKSFFWNLELGRRILYLCLIAMYSQQFQHLIVTFRCLKCNEFLETQVTADEIVELQRNVSNKELVAILIEGKNISIRLPTGLDQLEWLKNIQNDSDNSSYDKVSKKILSTLIVDPIEARLDNCGDSTSTRWLDAVGETMTGVDPLVNYTISVQCPSCKKETKYDVDLDEIAVRILQDIQKRLIEIIHRIALSYHWQEQEIISLPPWRIAQYLAMIERDAERGKNWIE